MKYKPMTKFRKTAVNLSYTKEQFDKMKAGFISSDMEDKWDITYKSGFLHFYRSWTGEEIYLAKIEQTDNGCQIREIHIAGDYDESIVANLIELYLLN